MKVFVALIVALLALSAVQATAGSWPKWAKPAFDAPLEGGGSGSGG